MSFKDFSKQVADNITNDAAEEIERLCLICEREAKTSMKGGGKPHTPSRPGKPPHVDTGRLRASITYEIDRSLFSIIGRVGTNVEYGRYLELGTSRMSPRPWLRPALKRTLKQAKR